MEIRPRAVLLQADIKSDIHAHDAEVRNAFHSAGLCVSNPTLTLVTGKEFI